MAKNIFQEDLDRSNRKPGMTAGLIAASGFFALVLAWTTYTMFRIDIDADHFEVLIRKTGKDLKNADEIAPDETHKGVQKQVLTTGRYFYNPYDYAWEIKPLIEIKTGKLGVRVSLTGDDLPYGEFLAQMVSENEAKTKGIVPDVLKPGRYAINPYLFKVEDQHEPVTIPAGFKGVVTNLAGPFPKKPNELLVQEGERGVQERTFDPGTYFVNPYVTRVSKVDCRSQRFNLAEKKDMGFPSKDGFWVTLDGRIEFRINPEKAAEVFVTYNEDQNGDAIDEEIVRKVIMPNARSICRLEGSSKLGREFIEGDTRMAFEKKFEAAMRKSCDQLGIEIVQAVITSIYPPAQIATPIKLRETARLDERKFKQQILQQAQEMKLAEQTELVKQKPALIAVNKEIVKLTTEAKREQEIAVTKANQELEVAKLKLEAAQDEAAAIVAKGEGAAEVIRLDNAAEAAGWKRSVEAFSGNGAQYAQYVLFQKLSSAYRKIMVNTADSPIMKIFESYNEPVKDAPAKK
ncbi:MAG TPA: SPFH domain-containing protein [Planctomycetaceae bacterium]|nr:SPFH domain-containing protein [Planctomycetaceae bacterium]